MAHAVEATVPELTPWVRPMLRTMGWLSWTADGKRQERRLDRGLKQGGPLSNLLYTIAMVRPVKMAEAVARPEDMRATLACHQDDVNVVATPRAESSARSTFIEEMGKSVLVVHKLSVLTPLGRQPHPERQPHPDRQLRQESRALILITWNSVPSPSAARRFFKRHNDTHRQPRSSTPPGQEIGYGPSLVTAP